MATSSQVIVVGGGLAGLSAAHTVLERGGRVVLIERNPFCGGNSTKATSGINAAYTRTQQNNASKDSAEQFEKDTAKSANLGDTSVPATPLQKVLAHESAGCVHWLMDSFGLDLSKVGYMGGHTEARTHRGKERFPGMTITYGLMEKYENICASNPEKARLLAKSRVQKLLTDESGAVYGCEYTDKNGKTHTELGSVILCTGGYGADFSKDSLLMKYRPELFPLPTTNGDHCKGDGIKMSMAIGGDVVDMERVQVHPTGLVEPGKEDAKVKWLAAEALRGVGAIILDKNGNRFVDELGRREHVTTQIQKNVGPFRLILNGAASNEISWHCKHYVARGLMKHFKTGNDLAKEIGCSPQHLENSFNLYNECGKTKKCPFGKTVFNNANFQMNDNFHVAQITPVVHYTMGGIKTNEHGAVLDSKDKPVTGLFCAGEVLGGIHGKNRLGGSSLLDCVVYGRVSARKCCNEMLSNLSVTVDNLKANGQLNVGGATGRLQALAGQVVQSTQEQKPQGKTGGLKTFDASEVAKHNTDSDCWVIISGEVYDVTNFLIDHPGGKEAIMLFAGQDATESFDMLHQPSVLQKFGPEFKVGSLKK